MNFRKAVGCIVFACAITAPISVYSFDSISAYKNHNSIMEYSWRR